MRDFKLSDRQMQKIIDSLDETGGFLIKESELKYWIEYFVNNEDNYEVKNDSKN